MLKSSAAEEWTGRGAEGRARIPWISLVKQDRKYLGRGAKAEVVWSSWP